MFCEYFCLHSQYSENIQLHCRLILEYCQHGELVAKDWTVECKVPHSANDRYVIFWIKLKQTHVNWWVNWKTIVSGESTMGETQFTKILLGFWIALWWNRAIIFNQFSFPIQIHLNETSSSHSRSVLLFNEAYKIFNAQFK